MRGRLALLALLLIPVALVAAPAPETVAIDRAHEALAEGDPTRAARLLRAALPSVSEPEARARVQCLLGTALLAGSDEAGAERVASAVPLGAGCGLRAAFLRARALELQGEVEEAARLYEELGATALGDDRDGRSAESIATLSRRLLADPSRGSSTAVQILETTLSMRISPERAASLGREIAIQLREEASHDGSAPACEALVASLVTREDRADRLLAASVCDASTADLLLGELPEEDPDALWLRAGLADPETATDLRLRALDATTGEALVDRRRIVAGILASELRLDALPLLEADDGPEALRRKALLLGAAGRTDEALAALAAHLERFPTDPERSEVADAHANLLLASGRALAASGDPDAAIRRFDAIVAQHPGFVEVHTAAYEAGLAERAAGRPAEARRRWEELVARWPDGGDRAIEALARQQAFDADGRPDAALDALRRRTESGASDELRRLESDALWVETRGRATRSPVVRVGTRNLERVEVRLHEIDLEAYVRAGGRPDDLGALDVAAIAPDRTFTVPVAGYAPYRDFAFDVPIPTPGPGLYAVTVASAEEEARALLLVSDLSVVVRAVGPDLAIGTFDADGRPVGGARILVAGGETVEGKTDGTGLWTTRLEPPGTRVVLAEKGGSWAVATLESTGSALGSGLSVSAELDRPIWLPGDTIGLRAQAHDADGRPLPGDWQVWLEGPLTTTPQTAHADEAGRFATELEIPPVGRDAYQITLPVASTWTVWGIPPGEASAVQITSVAVAPADVAGRTLSGRIDGEGARLQVRGPAGEPVSGVPLVWATGAGVTDARGELFVDGPPAGLPWTLRAWFAGDRGVDTLVLREPAERAWVELALAQDHLRPGERAAVTVGLRTSEGPVTGPVRVTVDRRLPVAPTPEPPADPWVPTPETGLAGGVTWTGSAPGIEPRVREGFFRTDAVVDGPTVVTLPELAAGDWVVTVTGALGSARSETRAFSVSAEGLRLVGAGDTGLGDTLSLRPEGTAALLTAESDHLLWAAVRPEGRAAPVAVDADWRGTVVLAATAPDGQVHVREVVADPSLSVVLTHAPDGDGHQLRATVTDRAGRPIAAEVSWSAWDERLEAVMGEPRLLSAQRRSWSGTPAGAIGAELRDGAFGEPIAPALLAEAARARERERALEASAGGLLSDNALAEALLGDVPMFGTRGYGGGGSGYGSGGGGVAGGVLGGQLGGVASGSGIALPGVRERVLWQITETDRTGRVEARLVGPPARWHLRATAVTARGVGTADTVIDTTAVPWWVVAAPEPGLPGDTASPLLTLVNGTSAPIDGRVGTDGEAVELSLAPGASQVVALAAREAGPAPVLVRWTTGEQVLQQAHWRFPLREGPPDPEGPLTVVATGSAGVPPLAAIAARPDPADVTAPWRTVVTGRAAVAVLQFVTDPALRRRVRDTRAMVRTMAFPSPSEAAQALLFLAEANTAGIVRIPRSELQQAADAVPSPVSAADRVWWVRARVAAGLPVDPNVLVVMREEAAQAGDLVIPTPAQQLASGPPMSGDPALPDWITAVGSLVAGRRAAPDGGAGSLVVEGPGAADTARPAGTWTWRAGVPPADGAVPQVMRIPAGTDGRPVVSRVAPDALAPCAPCRLAVGDVLALPGLDLGAGAPSGLRVDWSRPGEPVLRAITPGRFTVTGLVDGDLAAAPLLVEVGLDTPADDLLPAPLLAVAAAAVDAGSDVVLPRTGSDPDQARRAASLAFEAALLGSDDARIGSAFRSLAAIDPDASVALPDVARAARALRATGDPAGAIRVWRAGLDAAFVAEAASIGRVELHTGLLVAIQRVREAAFRYPDGPSTGAALYLLPARLLQLADDGLPAEVEAAGITATDVRLTAAAWDREFLGLYADHELAPAAGLRLARVLLSLGAFEPAASWAARVAGANPEAPLIDGLVYLEALARTEAGDADTAERLLDRLVHTPFPDEEGVPGPSMHHDDAELVLGRLYESRGQIQRALVAYAEAGGSEEAERARIALQRASLTAPPVVRLGSGGSAGVDLEAINVDTVRIRAYRVDLRTLFLRDGGLGAATRVGVAGVSPTWAGTRTLSAGPFPVKRRLDLPLGGAGAWLVQIEGDGVQVSLLVVRSALEFAAIDNGDTRRVAVRRAGVPASGIEVRALAGGIVVPAVTDVRGVAEVPVGAAVLAWDGASFAFTDPQEPAGPPSPSTDPDDRGLEPLLELLDQRLRGRQQQDEQTYRQQFDSASESLKLHSL